MTSAKSKDRKSLCEESMLVFVNILKLSSLSLARRTLVKTSNDAQATPSGNNLIIRKAVDKGSLPLVPTPQQQRSKRSQKPKQAQSSKYVMLPDHDNITRAASRGPSYRAVKEETANVDGKFIDYIRRFHEKAEEDHQNAIVEGKAESFIKRFHEKNMSDLNNESRRRNYVMPPPPGHVFN